MKLESSVREWFRNHGRISQGPEYEINRAIDEEINALSNTELLLHISMALEREEPEPNSTVTTGDRL